MLLPSVPRAWCLALLSRRIPSGKRFYPRASPSDAAKVIAEYTREWEEELVEEREAAQALAEEKAKLPRIEEQVRSSGAPCPHCKTVPTEWRALLHGVLVCGNCKRSSALEFVMFTSPR